MWGLYFCIYAKIDSRFLGLPIPLTFQDSNVNGSIMTKHVMGSQNIDRNQCKHGGIAEYGRCQCNYKHGGKLH